MISLMTVGLGGFLGTCARYAITKTLSALIPRFPFGTLLSNVLAGFLIGFIVEAERHSAALPDKAKLFLVTGLLGGLSTFSTFSMETVNMLESGKYASAGANAALNVGLSLICVFAGIYAAKTLHQA